MTTADCLEAALLHALTELPRAETPGVPVGRVWNIPPRLPEFTGRSGTLDRLDAVLVSDGRAVVQAVTGMGGMGRTSAAIEYTHRHRDRFDIAWWIRAEDPALVPDRLAELARALMLADSTDSTSVALERLRAALHGSSRWLVVFDNAEDPRALAPLSHCQPRQASGRTTGSWVPPASLIAHRGRSERCGRIARERAGRA